MSTLLDQIKYQYKSGSMNLKLIMVNVAVFVAVLITTVIFKMFQPQFSLLEYLAVPSDFNELLLKPWTIISYMFSHSIDGIGHLFWNMLLLYFAGNFFQMRLGGRKLLSTYFLGGLAGYLLFAIGYNFFPALANQNIGAVLIGASAAVTAIFVAIGVYMPNYEVRLLFIPQSFKLIYIVAFFVLLDFIHLQTSIGVVKANTGGWIAHIGGAIFGVIYAMQLKQGRNIGKWFENLIDKIINFSKPQPKLKVKRNKRKKKSTSNARVPRDDYDYNEQKVNNQKKTDAILDKISKSGYESLTKAEKDFLFRQSNN